MERSQGSPKATHMHPFSPNVVPKDGERGEESELRPVPAASPATYPESGICFPNAGHPWTDRLSKSVGSHDNMNANNGLGGLFSFFKLEIRGITGKCVSPDWA